MIHMFLCVPSLLDFDCSFHFPFSGIGVGRHQAFFSILIYVICLSLSFFIFLPFILGAFSAFLFSYDLFSSVFRSSWLDSFNTFRALWPVTSACVFFGVHSLRVCLLC